MTTKLAFCYDCGAVQPLHYEPLDENTCPNCSKLIEDPGDTVTGIFEDSEAKHLLELNGFDQ